MKKTTMAIAAMLMSLGFAMAQDVDMPEKGGINKSEILTEEPQAILAANKEAAQAGREAFKNSLSKEQLDILANAELTKSERREALQVTLTEDQQAIMASNREASSMARDEFRATLTDEQKAQTRSSSGDREGARTGAKVRNRTRG